MIDSTLQEQTAMKQAAVMAGEYLESLPGTDLANFTVEQFMTLIEVIITGYLDEMVKIQDDDIPF
jgi:hypothetical protein